MKKKDYVHIEIRDYVETLMKRGLTSQDIADILEFEVGTRFVKYSVRWYEYCIIAKETKRKQ